MMGPSIVRRLFAALLALPAAGCLVTQTMVDRLIDTDNDGYWEIGYRDGADCDDDDPLVNPAAAEVCFDQLDNDCDGRFDEDGVGDQSIYVDADGDGFGDAARSISSCFLLAGYATNPDDCDDARADVNPAALESCNQRDDDCDGAVDDDAPGTTWHHDLDRDGYGSDLDTRVSCEGGRDWTDRGGDCDDVDRYRNPDVPETWYNGVDDDCSGGSDYDQDGDGYEHPVASPAVPDCDDLNPEANPGAVEAWHDGVDQDCDPSNEHDADADGHDAAPWGDDCDDTSALIAPGNAETWYDGVDQDCDAATEWDQDGDGHGQPGTPHPVPDDCDDRAADTGPPRPWYLDGDGDGWGLTGNVVASCVPLGGRTETAGDCDDLRGDVSPAAPEVCGGVSEDCDDQFDEGAGFLRFFDADGDGHGDGDRGELRCPPFLNWVAGGDDCADADATRNPNALESCNNLDDDCDALVDEDAGSLWYVDADADGYGNAFDPPVQSCVRVPGRSPFASDCDDAASFTFPGAYDGCDGVDQDCDGEVDQDGFQLLFLDLDADGYGQDATSSRRCPEDGWSPLPGDCADDDPGRNPGAEEVCDDDDENCTPVDDDFDRRLLYPDGDGDGYGVVGSAPSLLCPETDGWALNATDCDDRDPRVHPGQADPCNGIDENCVDGIDDGARLQMWPDRDEDGHGDADAAASLQCPNEPLWSVTRGDCDDTNDTVHPGRVDACDGGVDNDCDGREHEDATDYAYLDDDGDGYGARNAVLQPVCWPFRGFANQPGDCDDANRAIFPGAPEVCDFVDNDCDDVADDGVREGVDSPLRWYEDVDGDGHGGARVVGACLGDTMVNDDGDCDDGDADVYPGAVELCDAKDNDCDPRTHIDRDPDDQDGEDADLTALITRTSSICDGAVWAQYLGHLYLAPTSAATWTAAEAYCADRGYHVWWPDSFGEVVPLVGMGVVVLDDITWTGVVRSCEPGVMGPWAWYDGLNDICEPLSAFSLTGFGLSNWFGRNEAMTYVAIGVEPARGAPPVFGGVDVGIDQRTSLQYYVCEREL